MFDSKSFDSFAYKDPDYEGDKRRKKLAAPYQKRWQRLCWWQL